MTDCPTERGAVLISRSVADRYVNQEMHCKTSVLLSYLGYDVRPGPLFTAHAKRFTPITPTPGVHKCQAPGRCDKQIVYGFAQYLCVLSIELV